MADDRDALEHEVNVRLTNPPESHGFWSFFMQLVNDCRFWMFMVLTIVLLFAFFVVTDVLNPAILADIINAGLQEMSTGSVQ
jgi:hypothetical protein